MKKLSIMPLLILVTAFSVFAQTENREPKWERANLNQEEFSVEFPQIPINRSFVDNKGRLIAGFYSLLINHTYYFVRSGDAKNLLSFDSVKEFVGAHQPEETAITIGEFTGVKYTFRDDEDFFQTIVGIKANRRLYFFHTISETQENPDVARFFSSIRPIENFEENETQTVGKVIALDGLNDNSVIKKGGSGAAGGDENSTVPNRNSAVRILSKPSAKYTDLARRYLISGDVLLRVAFLENGQIGEIKPLKKLPFGLTKNAVEAARGIRFEPAAKDRKPFSVVKTIQYGFRIF